MAVRVGFPATIRCEPRQARKGAAVAADSCAGVRLARAATFFVLSFQWLSDYVARHIGADLKICDTRRWSVVSGFRY